MDYARADEDNLFDIKEALSDFSTPASETVEQIEAELTRILEWLKQVINSRRMKVEQCESMLRAAREQYPIPLDTAKRMDFPRMQTSAQFPLNNASQFNTFGDFQIHNYPTGNSGYNQSALMAENALRAAKQKLDRALKAESAVVEAIEVYNCSKEKLLGLITDTADSAKAIIERKARDIREYDQIDPPDISHDNCTQDAVSDNSFHSDNDPQTMVDESGSHKSDAKNVSPLPNPEKKGQCGKKDAQRKLQKMLPSIENGEGASSEYWRAKDKALGLTYPKGYQRVYDTFYGKKGSGRGETE